MKGIMEHLLTIEDFWGRRAASARFEQHFEVFGRSVVLLSNEEAVLSAVSHSLPLFSIAPKTLHPPFTFQLVVEPRLVAPPAPEDLMPRITYTGEANWLMLHLGAWGHAFVDLSRFWGTAVLSPTLAARPDLISRCLLNTVLLNFCIHAGFGMLHTSCLHQQGRVLLLLAPHNSGKSTTALHLALAGYQLVSDSMIFVWADESIHEGLPLQLNAFPVGRTKLRGDMTAVFPQLHPILTPEVVRQETKFNVDLRQLGEQYVYNRAIYPQRLELYLLRRNDTPETHLQPAGKTAVWQVMLQNSLYYDETAVWSRNIAQLHPLLHHAHCYHLTIGTNPQSIIQTLNLPKT